MIETLKTLERAHIGYMMLGGNIYFNTARDRERAATLVELRDPKPVEPPPTRIREPYVYVNKVVRKHHWLGTACVEQRSRYWNAGSRVRILDGAAFMALPKELKCRDCAFEFENA